MRILRGLLHLAVYQSLGSRAVAGLAIIFGVARLAAATAECAERGASADSVIFCFTRPPTLGGITLDLVMYVSVCARMCPRPACGDACGITDPDAIDYVYVTHTRATSAATISSLAVALPLSSLALPLDRVQ